MQQGVNIGLVVARERRCAGITQEDLALHLGVTKAAVSKWELGQSLPDVALLPRIAARFRLTLDELFDYRPQLDEEEIARLYVELLEQFSVDPVAAYERVERIVVDYYSCWPLLLQVVSLYLWRMSVEGEHVDRLYGKAVELLERIEAHADDVDAVMGAKILHGSALTLKGDLDGAIAVMESLRPERFPPIDDILAGLYEQNGDMDSCLKVQRQSLSRGLASAMGSIISQLPRAVEDAERARALLRAGDGMVEGFELERTNMPTALMYWGNAAAACVQIGEVAAAARYLERFVDALERFDVAALVEPPVSVLFGRPEDAGSSDAILRIARAQLGAIDLKGQFEEYAMPDAIRSLYAEDPRFRPLLERLAAL